MKNGQGSPNGGNGQLRFDPAGDLEVTEILPTATGEYLEALRKATQAHIQSCMDFTVDETWLTKYEMLGGGHPYRGGTRVPKEFLHPWNSWFWKNQG